MASEQDEKVLAELNETLAQAEKTVSNEEKLPKEHLSDFDTSSMTYLDISAAILEQTENLFRVTGECNRFAPEYLTYCKTMITAVNHLGSAFITKTAMHCREFSTKQIETLTAERLNQMLSFNFRKCSAALTEIRQTRDKFDLNYFNMLLSFDTAMQRLRATQKRAYDMNVGLISPHKIAENGLSFTPIDGCRKYVDQYSKEAPFREAPAYAIRYDAIEESAGTAQKTAGPAKLPEKSSDPIPEIRTSENNRQETVKTQAQNTEIESDHKTDPGEPYTELNKEIDLPAPDSDESENNDDIKFAVDFEQVNITDINPIIESKVRYLIEQYPEKSWREIFIILQDPVYCQQNPEYVKVFVKIIRELMANETKDNKT